ncbi:hypothetical protein Bhyg_16582, partial [Pseudolycoriella hygida]
MAHRTPSVIFKLFSASGAITVALTESSKMSYGWETSRGYQPIAQWVSTCNDEIPPNAVVGGYDISGENLYIGRTSHEGEIIPGKVVASHGTCYVSYGGIEHSKRNYQVLIHTATGTDFIWLEASHGEVPSGAVQGEPKCLHQFVDYYSPFIGGVGDDGERLFIGRVEHEGSMCIGKVHPSHNSCYIAFGGQEHAYQ